MLPPVPLFPMPPPFPPEYPPLPGQERSSESEYESEDDEDKERWVTNNVPVVKQRLSVTFSPTNKLNKLARLNTTFFPLETVLFFFNTSRIYLWKNPVIFPDLIALVLFQDCSSDGAGQPSMQETPETKDIFKKKEAQDQGSTLCS